MENKMKFDITDNSVTVYFFGDIDHETTLAYRDRLVEKIAEGKFERVILNFASVTFIDSSGIGMVLGQLYLAQLPEATYRLFDLTGLFSIIEVISQKEGVTSHE